MYTQCEHCKAIFRVSMREVTIAKGMLRCGECQQVFNATDSLSTQMPKAYQDEQVPDDEIVESLDDINTRDYQPVNFTVKGVEEGKQKKQWGRKPRRKTEKKQQKKAIKQTGSSRSLKKEILLSLLAFLLLMLIAQLLYHYRYIFTGEAQHHPEQIQMLNHNVFAHPNEPGVLLISGSFENTAKKAQPFPLLEVKLTNSQSQVVALRRFKPEEYLEKYDSSMLLPVKQSTRLKLKIKDPGNSATRFQFNFY